MREIAGSHREKAPLYVGYFLSVTYDDWTQSRVQLWCPKPPLKMWEAVISNAQVIYATLTRRRRIFRSFNRRLAQAAIAALNDSNRGFSLMR